MKQIRWLLIFTFALPLTAQNVRWDLPVYTTQAQGGNLLPVYAIPGALVSFYNEPSGTLANTYNSATSVSACPTGAQVVLNGSAACVSSADPYGNMGSWFLPGQYMATITASGRSNNYYFTIGGGSSGGVTLLNGLSGSITLVPGSGLSITPAGQNITIALSSGFTITSFTGCGGSLELGQTVTNPTCSATYSGGTPASASITNTDSIDSPLSLVSPYTSGTIVGSFMHSAVATTTVQLTAIGSSTQTANQTYTWNPRIFGGIGVSGASSTVTASGTTAVLSTSNVLASAGLGAETIGETFGPYAPSGQVVYLLLTGGSHTFTDACSGFPFAFNSPLTVTFVNQYSVTVTMYLYQSTNTLTGSCFSPKVAT